MRTLTYITLSLLLAAGLLNSGCEVKYDVDLDQIPPALVVDGLVRDNAGPHYVILSLTSSYFSTDSNPAVSGAFVTITEDDILTDTLQEVQPGKYQSSIIGHMGSTYKLKIEYNGDTYEATSTIKRIAPIDSLTYAYDAGSAFVDEGYYVSINTQEIPGAGDYYRFLYYTNGEIEDETGFWVSDEFVDGNYISYNFDHEYPHELGDTAAIEVLSISEDNYNFLNALANQEESGDLFDVPPGNIKGNISNGAYGFFQASGSISDTIIIQ